MTPRDAYVAIARELKLCEGSIIEFAKLCKTHDPHDKKHKIKPFPIHKEYLQKSLLLMHTATRLAVYKSRQMMMTWTASIEVAHHALFGAGTSTAMISKKEEDAGKLVGRVKLIYDNLPLHIRVGLPEVVWYRGKKGIYLKMVVKHLEEDELGNKIETPATVQAYPEGGDQVRMECFSLAYWDEVGFADDTLARQTWAALLPTLEGGGRVILTSTPSRDPEHFFEQLCSGQLLG